MRLSGVVLAVCLAGTTAHAADETGLSDEFLEFLAEWDEPSEEWLDAVGLEERELKCNEREDGGECNDEE